MNKKTLWVGVGLAALLLLVVFLIRRQQQPQQQPTTIWQQKYNDLSVAHQHTLHDLAEQRLLTDSVYQRANDTTKILMVMDYARALSMGVDSLLTAPALTPPAR